MLLLRRCFWYGVSFSIEKPSFISENSHYLFHLLMYIYHKQIKKEKYHQQKAYDLMIKQLASHWCRLKKTKAQELNIGRLWDSQQLIQKIVPLELLFDSNTKDIKSRWLIIIMVLITLCTAYAWKHEVDFGRFSFGSETIPAGWNTFKNEEKCLLFHVKSTFRS